MDNLVETYEFFEGRCSDPFEFRRSVILHLLSRRGIFAGCPSMFLMEEIKMVWRRYQVHIEKIFEGTWHCLSRFKVEDWCDTLESLANCGSIEHYIITGTRYERDVLNWSFRITTKGLTELFLPLHTRDLKNYMESCNHSKTEEVHSITSTKRDLVEAVEKFSIYLDEYSNVIRNVKSGSFSSTDIGRQKQDVHDRLMFQILENVLPKIKGAKIIFRESCMNMLLNYIRNLTYAVVRTNATDRHFFDYWPRDDCVETPYRHSTEFDRTIAISDLNKMISILVNATPAKPNDIQRLDVENFAKIEACAWGLLPSPGNYGEGYDDGDRLPADPYDDSVIGKFVGEPRLTSEEHLKRGISTSSSWAKRAAFATMFGILLIQTGVLTSIAVAILVWFIWKKM